MRLQQYINEEHKPLDLIIKELFDKCYPFIKELNKTKNLKRFLYSGRGNQKDTFIGKVRDDRHPMDTPDDIQEKVDDIFEEKFGWRPRSNSVFCTGDWDMAENYGLSVYSIFPIGKYKYVWSPKIYDFYSNIVDNDDLLPEDPAEVRDIQESDVEDRAWDPAREAYEEYAYDLDPDEDETLDMDLWMDQNNEPYLQDAAEEIAQENKRENEYRIKDIIKSYKKTNLGDAIKSGNEIMLNTKKYMAIKIAVYEDKLIKYFNKYGSKKPTKEILEEIKQW